LSNLTIFGKSCKSVFGLNGYDENSATYSIGWGLDKSATLLTRFIHECIPSLAGLDLNQVTISLQEHGEDKGYTDLEIKQPDVFHIIVEAKRNWELPSEKQLNKYIPRFKRSHCPKENQILITMSSASEEYANLNQQPELEGHTIKHFSWKEINNLIKLTKSKTSSFEEKLWLRELAIHTKGYNTMTDPNNNLAYCVVVSTSEIKQGTGYTWVDVIEKDSTYFHPVGGNWPVTPPNYMAFRRKGKLTSVHHIDSYDITNKLQNLNSKWPDTKEDHFVYKLGPAMKPPKIISNGKLYATGRYWCALDTLISGAFETISDARDETKRRAG